MRATGYLADTTSGALESQQFVLLALNDRTPHLSGMEGATTPERMIPVSDRSYLLFILSLTSYSSTYSILASNPITMFSKHLSWSAWSMEHGARAWSDIAIIITTVLNSNPFSTGTDFRRQNLTSVDVRL